MSCGSHQARNTTASTTGRPRAGEDGRRRSSPSPPPRSAQHHPGEQPEDDGEDPLRHRCVSDDPLPPGQDVVEPGERREVLVVQLVVVADVAGDAGVARHRGVVAVVVRRGCDEHPEQDHRRHRDVDHPRHREPPPSRHTGTARSTHARSAAVARSSGGQQPDQHVLDEGGAAGELVVDGEGHLQPAGLHRRECRRQHVDRGQLRPARPGQLGAVARDGQHGVIRPGEPREVGCVGVERSGVASW